MIEVLQPIEVWPVRPQRPNMPVGNLTYADWLSKHRDALVQWYMDCYQRSEATPEEWADYCRAQFLAEQEFES